VKDTVVARNYAEALLELAEREEAVERYGGLLDTVAGIVEADPTIRAVLMSPRVRKAQKQEILGKALHGLAPDGFVRFLQAVVRRGRQGLFGEMSVAFEDLADQHYNRAHASVTTARPADEALRKRIAERLTEAVGKTVLPHFREDPAIIGGVLVRVGDRVFDGTIRRRVQVLRGRMLHHGGPGA